MGLGVILRCQTVFFMAFVWSVMTSFTAAANHRAAAPIFSAGDSVPLVTKITSADGNLLNLESGTYKFKLKVFKTSGTKVPGFSTQIASPYLNLDWDIAGIKENEWVLLSKDVILDSAVTNSKFSVIVYNNMGQGWGEGVFYIDDIRFEKETTTDIPGEETVRYRTYPNPFNKYINIDAPKGTKVKIYSLGGSLLYTTVLSSSNARIEFPELSPGVYVCEISYLKNRTSVKLIKQN